MRILFTPLTGSSIAHVVRSLAIADELRDEGHEVLFTSGVEKAEFISEQGYDVVKTYGTVNLNDPEDQSENYLHENRGKFVEWFQSEIDAVREHNPDVVVSAGGILGPHTYYATGVPIVTILDSQYLVESKGLMGLSRSTDSLRDQLTVKLLKPLFEKKFINLYLKEILAIYEELKLPHAITTRSELYAPMRKIIPSDYMLEPVVDKYIDTLHVGPIFWHGFERLDDGLTDKKIQKFKGNKKLIYIMFGGSVFKKEVYEIVISSFSEIDTREVVCFGPNWNRDDFPEDTETTLYRKYVYGLWVVRNSDIIVHTGAQGTVSESLYYGKPQIAIPTIMDQAYFANRIEELGCGINVNKVGLLNFSKREAFSNLPEDIDIRIKGAINLLSENFEKFSENASKHQVLLKNYPDPAKRAMKFILDTVI